MFGFKLMITGSPLMISSDGMKPMRFDSISKASLKHSTHTKSLLNFETSKLEALVDTDLKNVFVL